MYVKSLLLAPSVGILITLASTGRQTPNFVAKTATGQTIEISGVCSATESGVACWKPDGTQDKRESELVSAFFVANPNQKLALAYKSRTRIVLVREVSRTLFDQVQFGALTDAAGHRLENLGKIGDWQAGEETIRLFWYYPQNEDATVDLTTATWETLAAKPRIDLKPGATAKLGGETVRIDSIKRVDPAANAYHSPFEPPDDPKWEVRLSYTLDSPSTQPINIYGSPSDFNDNVIEAVDREGNPTRVRPFVMRQQLLQSMGNGENPPVLMCRVKPETVKFLTLYLQALVKLRFAGIHLEPNPPKVEP